MVGLEKCFTKTAWLITVLVFAGVVTSAVCFGGSNDEKVDRPGVINIINFIRAVEPRVAVDLVEPVRKQIELIQEKKLAATWLVQYDALCEKRFVSLLKGLDERQEVGGWFEVVQPLVEDAGLLWRGRFPWDWHSHVGFSIGYTPKEREKLVDVYMNKFKQVFGKYPEVVGSWFMDAHTLGYLADKYKTIGSCNAKEQIGTDGYTLWGGYYNQAYYPSRLNSFMPAQSEKNQIPIPVFRMLGNDPIWAYESFTGRSRGIHSMEPVYKWSGGSPEWVKWFFNVNFHTPCLSFGYTQAGQENSFGWPRMGDGYIWQVNYIADEVAKGRVNVWTLGRTSKWFTEKYKVTPASAITALSDWRGHDLKSVWYCSRFYRASLLWDKDRMWFRDIHRFDENYPGRYLKNVCTTSDCRFDALPILDGGSWSDSETTARIEPVLVSADGKSEVLRGTEPEVREVGASAIKVNWPLKGRADFEILFEEQRFSAASDIEGWALKMFLGRNRQTTIVKAEDKRISYEQSGHSYEMVLSKGRFKKVSGDTGVLIYPEDGEIAVSFK